MTGGYGRFVWMATFDSENQVRYSKENRPFVRIARDGQLLPETKAVIAVIAKHNLVMATGHSSAEEDLLLVREAKAAGSAAHGGDPCDVAADAYVASADAGGGKDGGVHRVCVQRADWEGKQFDFADYAKAIRYVGVDHCILSSDMGQPENPLHPDGLLAFFRGLREQGFTQAEIDRMAKKNPARLIGLE